MSWGVNSLREIYESAVSRELMSPTLSSTRFYKRIGVETLKSQTNLARDDCHLRMVLNFVAKEDYVLDAGCGYGRILVPLVRGGYRVVGVDKSYEFVKTCKSDLSESRVIVGDLIHCPTDSKVFDKVVCVWSVINELSLEDLETMLLEMVRVLKPGGRALIEAADTSHATFIDLCRREGFYMNGGSRILVNFDGEELVVSQISAPLLCTLSKKAGFSKCSVNSVAVEYWRYPRIVGYLEK